MTSRTLEAATEAVEEAESELAALEQERKQLEHGRADAQRAEEEEHQIRRAEIRRKITLAEAEAKKQRMAHTAAALNAAVEAAEVERLRDDQRKNADVAEKTRQLAARVQPVIDRARATYTALKRIDREHGAHLQNLTSVRWDQTPSTWPGPVRAAWNNEIHDPAIKFRHELHLMIVGLESNLRDAVALLARGWSGDPSFPSQVNEVIRLLSYSDGYVESAEWGLADLHRRLADILERAGFDPRATPDVIEVMPHGLREVAMAETRARMAESGQQTRAER